MAWSGSREIDDCIEFREDCYIRQHQPDKIITLGGDCAVSLAPFAWLADKYANDVAILWIDGHPDLGIPGDEYTGYHAMV